MKSYIDNLERLGHPMSLNLRVSLILIFLRKEFDSFVQNYNMHSMGKTVNKSHAMLKLHEQTLAKKDPAVYVIRAGKYLAELLKNKKLSYGASDSSIFTIELYTFPSKSWVYDIGCGTNICNTTQDLRGSRKLKPGALSLYVGNGQRTAVEEIRSFHLCLPSGSVIVLNNCHYAPSITRGIIYVYHLYEDGFVNRFVDNTILVSRNNIVYFSVIPRDGIFEIDLSDSYTNDSSMYAVSKRAKLNLNSDLLWHCRLGHISRKRIEKLQHDGLLDSTDLRAFEKCVSEDTHPSIDTSLNHEEDDLEIDDPQSDNIPICRSIRTRHAPDHPESEKWIDAMNVEMQSMKDNKVWDLVDLPPDGKTVGSKWLFKKKTDMDGDVHTFKARLVAKGFTQTYRVVADIRAIRILIAIAAYYDYEIWQMDVKTAFLNGHLSEEVYMEQPEGFVNQKYPDRVCKLKCFIYGLKQASRQWNKRFNEEIKKFGFTQNRDEPCVYLKACESNVTFLILYVHDILIMGNNIPMLQDVKSYIRRCFAMKDLGEATYILEIKIYRDRSRSIPMQEKLRLSKSQGASTRAELKYMQNVPYASAVGSIMYVVRCNRPDVTFAQNMTSQFKHNPGDIHWTTVKNILKYVTDADDPKSQTGYVFVLNGGVVDCKSTKQSIFITSSAEAEYIATYDASKEAV
ncbi:retrotransposon protein, putative, ty1-copia subclass [Tanacetum coccineum]